jgi:hypothetical protein
LKKIGERAFTGCISLRSICIPASVESIGKECFGLAISDEFYRCKALEYVIIESGSMLREVGSGIFFKCDGLHRIEILPDFTRIQRNLFHDQESNLWVKEIENDFTLLKSFDDYCLLEEAPVEFDRIPNKGELKGLSDSLFCRSIIERISIPSFVKVIYGRWEEIDYELHDLEIPSSIEAFEGSSTFFGFSSLEDLRFANDSQIIAISGFRECKSLIRVSLPSSVEFISGFCRCELLSEVLFANNSHLIEIDGFGECGTLNRIEIPSTVEKISARAFLKCKSLSEVIIESNSQLKDNCGISKVYRTSTNDNSKIG